MFILLLIIYLCSLIIYDNNAFNGDVTLWIKAGEFMLDNHTLINKFALSDGDLFSWYSVNWIPHEQGWYLLTAIAYQLGKCLGVTLLSCLFGLLTMSVCIFTVRIKENVNTLSIVITLLLSGQVFFMPVNSHRPDVLSSLLFTIQISLLIYCDNKKLLLFAIPFMSFLMAWFHGGIIIVYFAVLFVWFTINLLIDRNLKDSLVNLIVILLSFIMSLCTNVGISIYTYNSKQSMYPEIRAYQGEWQPGEVNSLLFIIILTVIIGLVLDDKFRSKDKRHLLLTALFCMFSVSYGIYFRMIRQLGIVFLLSAPIAFSSILKYFNITIKSCLNRVKKFFIIFTSIIILCSNLTMYNSYVAKDINEALFMVGCDIDCINFIKDNNYSRVYVNVFDSTQFIWNDIKTSGDLRIDPFLKSVSGKDYLHNKFSIDSITHLDMYVNSYKPDAIILVYPITSNVFISGEEYPFSNRYDCFINEIDSFCTDRYIKVYDNVTYSKYRKSIQDSLIYEDMQPAYRYIVYEPVYS